jgi:hypothetical protein
MKVLYPTSKLSITWRTRESATFKRHLIRGSEKFTVADLRKMCNFYGIARFVQFNIKTLQPWKNFLSVPV